MIFKRLATFLTALAIGVSALTFTAPVKVDAAVVSKGEFITITKKNQLVDSITYHGVKVDALYCPFKGRTDDEVWGDEWCCAAFIQKFYDKVYGIGVGNLYPGSQPTVYNGSGSFVSTNKPVVGDICGMSNHWAIVKQVLPNNQYLLIEQNWAWTNGPFPAAGQPYGDVVTEANVGRIVTGPDSEHWFYHYTKSYSTGGGPTSAKLTASATTINHGGSVKFTFSGSGANYYDLTITDANGWQVDHYNGTSTTYTTKALDDCNTTYTARLTASNLVGYKESSPVTIKVNHKWSNWEVWSQATCTTTGESYRHCEYCWESETKTTPKTGHDYHVTDYVAPTLKSSGYKEYVCSRCGNSYRELLPRLVGPTVTMKVNSAAAGATVTYTNTATNKTYTATGTGTSLSVALPAGTYTAKIEKAGLASRAYSGITVGTSAVTLNGMICKRGDLNGDGYINSTDLGLLISHVKGTKRITDKYLLTIADVDKDGSKDYSKDLGLMVAHVKGTRKLG